MMVGKQGSSLFERSAARKRSDTKAPLDIHFPYHPLTLMSISLELPPSRRLLWKEMPNCQNGGLSAELWLPTGLDSSPCSVSARVLLARPSVGSS
jgi:hypothetical protein